jgi:hypothetical protein
VIAVRTVTELDALPVDADVEDFQKDTWRKQANGRWRMPYDDAQDARGALTSETLRYLFGPLWRREEGAAA